LEVWLSSRVPALQVSSPELKFQSHKKKRKKRKIASDSNDQIKDLKKKTYCVHLEAVWFFF
jgi:hypothetical protein